MFINCCGPSPLQAREEGFFFQPSIMDLASSEPGNDRRNYTCSFLGVSVAIMCVVLSVVDEPRAAGVSSGGAHVMWN